LGKRHCCGATIQDSCGPKKWPKVEIQDIFPDSQRFLTVKLEEKRPKPVTEMILVQNWLDVLKRL